MNLPEYVSTFISNHKQKIATVGSVGVIYVSFELPTYVSGVTTVHMACAAAPAAILLGASLGKL